MGSRSSDPVARLPERVNPSGRPLASAVAVTILVCAGAAFTGGPARVHLAAQVPAPTATAPATTPAPTPPSAPPDTARYEALAKRARARLQELQREADQLVSREQTLLGQLRKLEIERDARTAELAQANAEVAAAEADLAAAQEHIDALTRQIEAARPAIATRVVRLYKEGALDSPARWLEVDRLQDAARAHRLLSTVARQDRDRLQAFGRQLDDLTATRSRLDTRSREAAEGRARAEAARAAAARAAWSHTALVASIDARRDLAARLTGELQQAGDRLQAAMADLGSAPAAGVVVLPLKPFQGDLDWPVRGPVTAPFGRSKASRFGTNIVRRGVEIGAAEGTPVKAVHEGRVAFAEPFSGFGRLVIVDHGQGGFSLYGHLASLDVGRGAHVDAGQAIGTSGRAPSGTPALYFELRIDGRAVDPVEWLKRQ